MARYEIQWSASGMMVVEADDQDEAEALAEEALMNLDTVMVDEFNTDKFSADSIDELED